MAFPNGRDDGELVTRCLERRQGAPVEVHECLAGLHVVGHHLNKHVFTLIPTAFDAVAQQPVTRVMQDAGEGICQERDLSSSASVAFQTDRDSPVSFWTSSTCSLLNEVKRDLNDGLVRISARPVRVLMTHERG